MHTVCDYGDRSTHTEGGRPSTASVISGREPSPCVVSSELSTLNHKCSLHTCCTLHLRRTYTHVPAPILRMAHTNVH
jgi:hypothetical protein